MPPSSINYGIKTGLNKAFIVGNETKEALVREDPRSAELLKPVVRGRDVHAYRVDWKDRWLIATFPAVGVDIDEYPAIRRWLASFGRRIHQTGEKLPDGSRARKRTQHAWWELQDSCAYHEEFSKEKLLWMDLTNLGRFAHDANGLYLLNTSFMMTGPALKYLCAVLNSDLVSWYMRTTALTSGMGLSRWIVHTVERIPVPRRVGRDRQASFVRLVDRARQRDNETTTAGTAGTTVLDEIEQRVRYLYGLTTLDVKLIR